MFILEQKMDIIQNFREGLDSLGIINLMFPPKGFCKFKFLNNLSDE
jgi:hypothetical protein